MRTQLLSHNKTAYHKVVNAFETSDRTCVVHPTGTGKSYLIAAVSESYKNVLILGPNVFVLNQVHDVLKWRKDGVEYMTYSLLITKDDMPTGYDLICIDEFHRAGAPEWGEAVDRLLVANPEAKVLGTTATPIRFLDDNRDMADELFGGNIASYMSLKDAWDRNILAVPRFVTGLFEFDKVADDIERRIRNTRRLNDAEKKRRITRINNLRLDWERSQGMPQIIRKHIDKDAKRIIVFCGNVEHLKEMEQTIRGWFSMAGIKIANLYTVHSYLTDSDVDKAMEGFESDDFGDGGVKLMLSVNLLNEGVHIPRVNAVILLRTTSSKIIYLQQIGRCLTADKTDKPIILDMVDNITTTNIVHDIRDGFDWYEHQKPKDEVEYSREPKDFIVYDYTLGIQDAIKKLVPIEFNKMPFEERIAALKAFCDEYGRTPTKSDDKDAYDNYCLLKHKYKNNQELIEIRNKYGFVKTWEYRYEKLLRFIDANDRLPVRKNEPEEFANYFVLYQRNKTNPDERIQAILDKYLHKIPSKEEVLQQFLDFVEKNNRLPSANYFKAPLEELTLRRYVRTMLSDNPLVQELLERYANVKVVSFDDRVAKLKAFVEKYDRLPKKETEPDEYANMGNIRRLNKKINNQDVIAIFDKYKVTYTDDEVKQRILDFFEKNGRLPNKSLSREESSLSKLFRDHRDPLYNDPELIPLLETRRKFRPFEESVQKMIAYTSEHGSRPDPQDKKLYNMWIRVVAKKDKDPRIMEMYMKYGGKPAMRMSEYMKPLADYIHEFHRLPSTTASREEYHLYAILVNLRKNYSDHPEVKPLLEEIASWPSKEFKRIAANDEKTKKSIIAFVEEFHRLPKHSGDKEENYLARQWTARRDRLCADDPVMQAILDQYDNRPLKFEERYAVVRDWAAKNGRLPRKGEGDIYQKFDTLKRTFRNTPEVQALLKKYGYHQQPIRSDINGRLDKIEAFADEHGRLPSTVKTNEKKLGRWWTNLKRNHGSEPRVIALKERFPIQNRK